MHTWIPLCVILAALPMRGQEAAKAAPAEAPSAEAIASIRAELEAMRETDQKYRLEVIELEKKLGRDAPEVKAAWDKQKKIDTHNIRRLEEIVAQHGWPGKTQYGTMAASAAFLILQHSELSYQKKYLPLARAAAQKGEMQASSLALLEDRIRLREGQKQLYGSQVTRNSAGEWEPLPLDDEAKVHELRVSVGLNPLSEYLAGFAKRSGGTVNPKWSKAVPKEAASTTGAAAAAAKP